MPPKGGAAASSGPARNTRAARRAREEDAAADGLAAPAATAATAKKPQRKPPKSAKTAPKASTTGKRGRGKPKKQTAPPAPDPGDDDGGDDDHENGDCGVENDTPSPKRRKPQRPKTANGGGKSKPDAPAARHDDEEEEEEEEEDIDEHPPEEPPVDAPPPNPLDGITLWDSDDVPARERKKLEKTIADAMDNFVDLVSPPVIPVEGHWVGGRKLGAGNFGTAYLYYHLDDEGNIDDRVAIKDTWLSTWDFTNFIHWWGNPRDRNTRFHVEIKVMQNLLAQPGGTDKCVRYRDSEKNDEWRWYRIYMDLCPHGSLASLIKPRDEKFGRPGRGGKGGKAQRSDPWHSGNRVPEPAVWKWFEDLTNACTVLAFGAVNLTERPGGWEKVVHRDLKLPNIFLKEPDEHAWKQYPTAVVGDFGVANFTDADDDHNPMASANAAGTPGCIAPECMDWKDATSRLPAPRAKIGDHTNVWGIGIIMSNLMNLDWDGKQGPNFLKPDDVEPKFLQPTIDFYTQTLRDLVERCTRFGVDERIGLDDLKAEISRCTAGPGADGGDALAGGMRAGQADEDDESMIVQYQPDRLYRLGMAPEADEKG